VNLGAVAVFAFVSSITPGPNNVMLWASGLNFGLRRTTAHLAGVNIGFMSLLFVTAVGLGAVFERLGWLQTTVRVLGSGYLLYLAYRIATAGRTTEAVEGRPLSFLEAAAFQYVNPKAWVMAIAATGSFLPAGQAVFPRVLLFVGVFSAVNLPCITAWAAGGTAMARLLDDDRRRAVTNGLLGLLLVGTVYLINV
jgi:threonine/homoserine/homoserine lactone efflux protein